MIHRIPQTIPIGIQPATGERALAVGVVKEHQHGVVTAMAAQQVETNLLPIFAIESAATTDAVSPVMPIGAVGPPRDPGGALGQHGIAVVGCQQQATGRDRTHGA